MQSESELSFLNKSGLRYSQFVKPQMTREELALRISSKPLQETAIKPQGAEVLLEQIQAENVVLRRENEQLRDLLQDSQQDARISRATLNQSQMISEEQTAGHIAAVLGDRDAESRQQLTQINYLRQKGQELENALRKSESERKELSAKAAALEITNGRLQHDDTAQKATIKEQYALLTQMQTLKAELTSQAAKAAVREADTKAELEELRAAAAGLARGSPLVLNSDLSRTLRELQKQLAERDTQIRSHAGRVKKLTDRAKAAEAAVIEQQIAAENALRNQAKAQEQAIARLQTRLDNGEPEQIARLRALLQEVLGEKQMELARIRSLLDDAPAPEPPAPAPQ